MKIGNHVCLVAGIAGCFALYLLSTATYYPFISMLLLTIGIMFVFVHSANLIMAQKIIPNMRGTAMALVSFGIFCGSGIGTLVNNQILEQKGVETIFISAAVVFFCLGFLSWIVHGVINGKMLIMETK